VLILSSRIKFQRKGSWWLPTILLSWWSRERFNLKCHITFEMRHSFWKFNCNLSDFISNSLVFFNWVGSSDQIGPGIQTPNDVAGYRFIMEPPHETMGLHINVGNATTYTLNGWVQQWYTISPLRHITRLIMRALIRTRSLGRLLRLSGRPTCSRPTSGITGTSNTYTGRFLLESSTFGCRFQFDWKGVATDLSPWGSATPIEDVDGGRYI